MATHDKQHLAFDDTPLTFTNFCIRATVSQECITAYNDLKLSKKYKYIIFKLSDDFKEIVIEHASTDKDWDNFRENLVNATSKTKSVRYADLSPGLRFNCPSC